jgi:hypothetical protein
MPVFDRGTDRRAAPAARIGYAMERAHLVRHPAGDERRDVEQEGDEMRLRSACARTRFSPLGGGPDVFALRALAPPSALFNHFSTVISLCRDDADSNQGALRILRCVRGGNVQLRWPENESVIRDSLSAGIYPLRVNPVIRLDPWFRFAGVKCSISQLHDLNQGVEDMRLKCCHSMNRG